MKALIDSCCRCKPKNCGLTVQDILKFAANLVLPLVLGVFTAVVTIHQHNIALQQRLEDRQLAKEQREQDLNISRTQRLEDRLIAREQREQDLNISREQREQDKQTAKLQREQDKQIADDKLSNDKWLSEERLRDEIFVRYMSDIIQLLKENNGSLTNDPAIAFFVRLKTLTTIRQLDPIRNTRLIHFLYKINQLMNGAQPLDLSDAELDNIDMSMTTVFQYSIRNISLVGAFLRNASFDKLDLSFANFSKCRLENASFDNSILVDSDFSDTNLFRTNFNYAQIQWARFIRVYIRRTNFVKAIANNAIFKHSEITFSIFGHCICNNVDFTNTTIEKTDFNNAHLENSQFVAANLSGPVFVETSMESVNFSKSHIDDGNFSIGNCEEAVFVHAHISKCSFFNTKAKYTDMSYADMKQNDFTQANLFASILSYANLENVIFNESNLNQVNLSYSKFGLFSEFQLNKAISIRGARLSNNSIIPVDRNLIKNGDAQCQISIDEHWNIEPRNSIAIIRDKQQANNCIYASLTQNSSTMSQDISFGSFQESIKFRNLDALITLKCVPHNQTLIRVNTKDTGQLLAETTPILNKNLVIMRFSLLNNTRIIFSITFGPDANQNWCDDIQLTLELPRKL